MKEEFLYIQSPTLPEAASLPSAIRHSAKADIHSAKPLPSVTLGKEHSVNSLSTKTSSDTRQRKVAVTASVTVTAALPSVKVKHSTKVAALPSAVDSDTRQR